jgi:hypothetical protein
MNPRRPIPFPEAEPAIIPAGVLVEDKKTGYIMRTTEYNENSNTCHCTSKDGTMYLGCFNCQQLVIIKDEDIKE